MGSYDSYEVSTPSRHITHDSAPLTDEPVGGLSHSEEPARGTFTSEEPAEYRGNTEYSTLVALGGGLSMDRIITKIPDEVKRGTLMDAVTYFLQKEYDDKRDKTIIAAVQERMQKPDYRALINTSRNDPGTGYNYHNRVLQEKNLANYFVEKSRETEDGVIEKINFVDIAIVSHEEGGLEELL